MKINADRVEQLQRTDETRSTHQAEASGIQAWVDQSPRMTAQRTLISGFTPASSTVQRMLSNHQPPESNLAQDRLNIIGEEHTESNARRGDEMEHCARLLGSERYWVEDNFAIPHAGVGVMMGDPPFLRFSSMVFQLIPFVLIQPGQILDANALSLCLLNNLHYLNRAQLEAMAGIGSVDFYAEFEELPGERIVAYHTLFASKSDLDLLLYEISLFTVEVLQGGVNPIRGTQIIDGLNERFEVFNRIIAVINNLVDKRIASPTEKFLDAARLRSLGMAEAAMLPNAPKSGVWKVGQGHVNHMAELPVRNFKLINRDDYNLELAEFKAYWDQLTPNTDESANPPGSE